MSAAIAGWRVLIPRGGSWGDSAAGRLHDVGAIPVIAPLIEFAGTQDAEALVAGLRELADGSFDWLVVTSATTARVLEGVIIPASTKVAAVGEVTATQLERAGIPVDFIPNHDFSAAALLAEWPGATPSRIFLPQSAIAPPALADGLRAAGNDVVAVSAYRTMSVAAPPELASQVRSGEIRAVLVTSGSVAREVAAQLAPVPATTALVYIGARTATEAAALGLPTGVIAAHQSVEAMIESLIQCAEDQL
ncbi:MAG: uroporphyrinogen-III synthase [Terrimesophilobacter sp.]